MKLTVKQEHAHTYPPTEFTVEGSKEEILRLLEKRQWKAVTDQLRNSLEDAIDDFDAEAYDAHKMAKCGGPAECRWCDSLPDTEKEW